MVVLVADISNMVLVLDYDIMTAEPFAAYATAKFPRKVTRVGMVGSTTCGDTKFKVRYGDRVVADGLYNTELLLGLHDYDMVPIVDSDVCKPEEPISVVITDAAAAAVKFKIEIE